MMDAFQRATRARAHPPLPPFPPFPPIAADSCFPQTPVPGQDLPGGDYAATPLPTDNSTACQDLCCSELQCVAWVYVPAAPGDFFGCSEGQHCCYLKSSQPAPNPSKLPGIISAYVTRPPISRFPPPLGMRSSVPLGGLGAGAFELRGDGTVHEMTIVNQHPAAAAKFGVVDDMLAAFRVTPAGGATVGRTLRTHPPAYGSGSGVAAITYSGSYPVSRLQGERRL
jgi:hypothetical protein